MLQYSQKILRLTTFPTNIYASIYLLAHSFSLTPPGLCPTSPIFCSEISPQKAVEDLLVHKPSVSGVVVLSSVPLPRSG
jgi:hypothetical protein